MKQFTLLTSKRHILLVLIMLLCSVRVAYADDSGLVTQQITVNVPTAGTLSNIIQSDKMFKITNLKITGFLNSDDIRFIRKMAGCYYNGNGSKYDGHLQYLDLGSISQISYVHSFEFYDENGYRSTLNDCLFPLAYLYNLKTVVLPNLYKDYNFSLMGCRNLTTAKMPDNLEKIGNNAFKDCDSLKNIQIPSAITSIGEYAFSGCSCLTDIQIPDNVTYIGKYAFYECCSLKWISLPSELKNISASTFENCSSLKALQLPYGITSLEEAVFANCFNLKEIKIPESVTTINNMAFVNCRSLTSITIPDNVTSIGEFAFNGCSNLKSLYLPANLKTIGDAAFNCCGSLTRINTKMKEPVAIGEDTFTGLDYDKCELLVPEGSAEAYRQAAVWSNFNNITDITVVVTDYAGSLRYMIEKNNNNYKNNITRLKVIGPINIYDIEYIREMAGCWLEESGKKTDGNLQYLDLQEAKLVGSNASINVYTKGSNQGETNTVECTAKIEPDGNDFSNLFRKVSKLNTVIMPEYLTTTGSGTFMDSPLSSITLPKNLTYIDDNAFNGCGGLRDISIPSGVTSIGKGAFKGCGLKEFTLPKQVNEITDEMFFNCSLQHIYLHDGLKSIGNYAFAISALKEITIPNSVAYIGDNCFQGCGGLEKAVILSDQITEIPNEAFADCNSLNIIKLPANLERIGERAFIGTWRLGTKEGLTIPSKVREIGAEAFYKSLFDAVDIVLPASLTDIYSAFEGSGVRVIHCYMPEPLPLNSFSFGGGGGSLSNCKLYVPKGCANKYRNAEVWRDFDIEEMEVTGIASVTNDSTITEVSRYDANGQQLSVPTKGLNIVRYSDGTVKKIMVE